ncbi:coiled-coil domain-containing protein [Nonomuraea sp. NPDC050663]|uniref:coiled-coil domain-containing protein n=1 Tax=Nonomuraea sp. NPDC050663 TaxID=3364370 RepID=UPI0037AB5B59
MAAKSAMLTAVVCTAVALTVGGSPAAADPKPSESKLRAELTSLDKKIDKLLEAYNAKRVSLAKAQKDEKAARDRLVQAEAQLADAHKLISQIAQLHYQGNPGVTPFLTPDSSAGAAVLNEITEEQKAAIAGVKAGRDAKQQAAEQATALAAQIKTETSELASQRKEAEKLIGEIKDKLEDLVPYGTGRRSDGSFAPELPSGSDNITPRTRLMRAEVQKNFALQFSVGCYRVDNSGEHPLGRACDFMMSSGGAMPSAAGNTLGDQVAAWAVKNMDKLGVKYVIWKQRINQGSGWRAMSDRGGITANHYDHVHISML